MRLRLWYIGLINLNGVLNFQPRCNHWIYSHSFFVTSRRWNSLLPSFFQVSLGYLKFKINLTLHFVSCEYFLLYFLFDNDFSLSFTLCKSLHLIFFIMMIWMKLLKINQALTGSQQVNRMTTYIQDSCCFV